MRIVSITCQVVLKYTYGSQQLPYYQTCYSSNSEECKVLIHQLVSSVKIIKAFSICNLKVLSCVRVKLKNILEYASSWNH